MENKGPKLENINTRNEEGELLQKKAWIKPDIELISSDVIRGGVVPHYTEGYLFGPQSTYTGAS